MRVLLDECLPRQLASYLQGYRVETVTREGWSGLTDGALLDAAAGAYDVVITIDRSLAENAPLPPTVGVVTLAWPSNRIESLIPQVPALLDALATVRPGERVRVSA